MNLRSSSMTYQRSLLPKEHGAYAELAFPLITGLALAPPSAAALALGGAAVALFLANEPVAILLGARGRRLKGETADRARSRFAFLLGGATGLGLLGIWRAGQEIWPEVLFPAAAAFLLIPLVFQGRQKTLSGEFLVITAFATLPLPLAAASGADPARALAATGVWWISFALGTLEVHAIKARLKDTAKTQWTRWGSPVAAAATVTLGLWLALGQASPLLRRWSDTFTDGASTGLAAQWAYEAMRVIPPAAVAILPPALAILVLSLIRVHPRRLKRVGWTLVGGNTLALVLLLQG